MAAFLLIILFLMLHVAPGRFRLVKIGLHRPTYKNLFKLSFS